ncbi:Ankyrin repeat domain-containing protein 27 [Bienertia sinuspersici]
MDKFHYVKLTLMLQKIKLKRMTEEDSDAAERGDVDFLKERLRTSGIDFLRSQDPNGQNILHKLMNITDDLVEEEENRFSDFVGQVLSSFPALLGEADVNGDTPIHILMRTDLESSKLRLLELCNNFISEMKEEARINGVQYRSLWIMQNADGNTPLHEALIRNHQYNL